MQNLKNTRKYSHVNMGYHGSSGGNGNFQAFRIRSVHNVEGRGPNCRFRQQVGLRTLSSVSVVWVSPETAQPIATNIPQGMEG